MNELKKLLDSAMEDLENSILEYENADDVPYVFFCTGSLLSILKTIDMAEQAEKNEPDDEFEKYNIDMTGDIENDSYK